MTSPDFEQIARQILDRAPIVNVDWKRITAASIAEQLRLVWNARGAADINELVRGASDVEKGAESLVHSLRYLDL